MSAPATEPVVPAGDATAAATQTATTEIAAASQAQAAGDITPAEFVNRIEAALGGLPDKVVEALRESTGSTSAPAAPAGAQNGTQAAATASVDKGGLFGGKTFADWWFKK